MSTPLIPCSECGRPFEQTRGGKTPKLACSAACKVRRDVRLAAENWQAELAASNGRPTRACESCGGERQVTPMFWPFSRGVPKGGVCVACMQGRQQAYDQVRDEKQAEAHKPSPELRRKIERARAKAERAMREAMVGSEADALLAGAAALNAAAFGTLAELAVHVRDHKSPMHADALGLLADRILPQAVVNEVAVEMAREGLGDDGAPQFVIQVVPTHGPDKCARRSNTASSAPCSRSRSIAGPHS